MKKYFLFVALMAFCLTVNGQNHCNLLIGTYTNSCKSDGVYVYDFNTETADFKLKNHSDKVPNPSFVAISPDQKNIYSVNESGKESTVSAFRFDAKSGKIILLKRQSSEGADPCHIINDEKNVLVANYSGGSIAVFKKGDDGSLLKAKQVVQHRGKSITKRQESPHVHQLQFSPDKQWVLANDLGTDRIYLYQYQPNSENEILKFKDTIAIKTGSGPRHLTFSPNGKFIYLLQELDGTLTVFAYGNAKLRRTQETSVVAEDFNGETSAADIHISPDGKFLYATNRGDANTISVFSIDSRGKLVHRQTLLTHGKGPRNFAIDPSGKYVLVAHQYTNNVVIFERNAETGKLTDTGKQIELCSPVCLVFTE